jgi:hypothetical protein
MYSDIARPYISGVFFCLLLVICWTNYFISEKNKFLNLFGFAVCAALCAYNHYFSLLFAVIVGATGLFFLTKLNFKSYLLACVFALLLFSPHLPLFFFQFGTGGLDWLGEPTPRFFIEYLQYIFQYSDAVMGIIALLLFAGIIHGRKELLSKNTFRVISIIWFLLPFLIGYYYSVHVKPVLQYSVLIFSFPFLLLFLFSFYRNTSSIFKTASVLILLLVNTYVLVFSREHYKVFYRQPLERYAKKAMEVHEDEQLRRNTSIILETDSNYLNYYFKKYNSKPSYYTFYHDPQPVSARQFRKLVASFSTENLVVGGMPLEYLNIAAEYFPFEQYHEDGYSYTINAFSKSAGKQKFPADRIYESTYGKNAPLGNWTFDIAAGFLSDSTFRSESLHPYGPTFSVKTQDVLALQGQHYTIDIGLSFLTDSIDNCGFIVFELKRGEKTLDWRAAHISGYFDSTSAHQWQRAYMCVRTSDVVSEPRDLKNTEIRIFYWNNDQKTILLKDFKVSVRKGNQWVYGLFARLN